MLKPFEGDLKELIGKDVVVNRKKFDIFNSPCDEGFRIQMKVVNVLSPVKGSKKKSEKYWRLVDEKGRKICVFIRYGLTKIYLPAEFKGQLGDLVGRKVKIQQSWGDIYMSNKIVESVSVKEAGYLMGYLKDDKNDTPHCIFDDTKIFVIE
jgi:hypothetical protein